MAEPSMPSGWFPDPLDRYDHRYFNGTNWTSDVSLDGTHYVDPLGARPSERPPEGNRFATASVVMGSIAIAIAWIPFVVVFGAALAVLALVFGLKGIRRSRDTGQGRGAAIAGTVMGAFGIAASVVGVVLSVIVWGAVIEFVEPGPNDAEVTSCAIDGRTVTVTGTITNRDDEPHDYTVFVEVVGRSEVATVDAVPPSTTAEWSVTATARTVTEECDPEITAVQGPFPFDIEVDPITG